MGWTDLLADPPAGFSPMSAEALTTTIADIRDRLTRNEFRDEAAVSLGIVIPVLQDLGWPVRDMTVVTPQYAIQGRRVDYALIGRYSTPSVLLEVKRVGNIEVGEEQLFAYAFRQGTPIIVLTDGRSWRLYLTTGEGSFEDRRFASVDLVEDDPEQGASALRRYLSRESVLDGQARKHAETDLDSRWRQRKAEEALPSVWSRLAADRGGPLVELVRSQVRDECGITPSAESVVSFLRDAPTERHPEPIPRPILAPRPAPTPTPAPPQGRASFTLGGSTRSFGTNTELLAAVFSDLALRDATFLERFAATRPGRKRVSRSLDDLDPGRRKTHAHLPGGWWVDAGMPNKGGLIEKACQVAGFEFGRDLVVDFRKRRPSSPSPSPPPPREGRPVQGSRYSFTLRGETQRFRTGADLMTAIFAAFAKNDAGFCERFGKRHKGAKLVYVARRPKDLYPEHPHLVKSSARELPGGYYLGTHMGSAKKEQLIRFACEVAGLTFGRDLTVELPVARRAQKQA